MIETNFVRQNKSAKNRGIKVENISIIVILCASVSIHHSSNNVMECKQYGMAIFNFKQITCIHKKCFQSAFVPILTYLAV